MGPGPESQGSKRRRFGGPAWVLAALVALFAGAAAGAPPTPDASQLRLAGQRAFDPRASQGRAHRALPHLSGHPRGVRGAYLVQFERPITGADRVALEEVGASVKGYVPMLALEVVLRERDRDRIASIPGVRFVGPVQPSWKIPARLFDAHRAAGETLRLRVSLYPGDEDEGIRALRKLGASIRREERRRSYAMAEIDLPSARLRALARHPLVRRVSAAPKRVPHNDRARAISRLALVADDTFSSGLDPGLDGHDDASGFQVKYGHTDSGLWSAHPDFQDGIEGGRISFEGGSDTLDGSGHGTHTAGTLVGDGSSWEDLPSVPPGSEAVSESRWRGIQPEAALHHISFDNDYSDTTLLERHSREGAQLLANSWGYSDCDAPGTGPCKDYNEFAVVWDEGVWDADAATPGLQPVTAFFAAGNLALEGPDGCPFPLSITGPDLITAPATAKNVITVGAIETDRGCGLGDADHPGDVLWMSSRGPVDPDETGRGLFKPDVMAVGGDYVLSAERPGTGSCAGSGLDCESDCSVTGSTYRYEGGTSMAAPVVAGVAGTLLQDLVVNRGVASPAPSLVKALLIHGAAPLQPSGACSHDYRTEVDKIHQGWGSVDATASLYGAGGSPSLRRLAFENELSAHALATGESHEVAIESDGSPLRVSLVWTDYPAAPGAGSPLIVNDLDLEVIGPGATFLGNNFSGVWSVPTSESAVPDRYNVVENVYLEAPVPGTHTIRVHAFQVSQDQEPELGGVNQDFSLVWTTAPVSAACGDGIDNDGDGLADAADPGCDDLEDASERSPLYACDDGIDNDGDGGTDYVPDGDGDGLADAPGDLACAGPRWRETSQCQDGVDNDSDGRLDFDGGQSIHGACSGGSCPPGVSDPDGDGVADADRQCLRGPLGAVERPTRCGAGVEALPLVGLWWVIRGLRRRRR
jgi:hypothetical protein